MKPLGPLRPINFSLHCSHCCKMWIQPSGQWQSSTENTSSS